MKKLFVLLGVFNLFAIQNSNATDWITINDMRQVEWQNFGNDGKIYFRNLNNFDSSFQGCCYSYWIDPNSINGKITWSIILTKIATGGKLVLGVADKTVGGNIHSVGVW